MVPPADLKDADDAAAGAAGLGVEHRGRGLVLLDEGRGRAAVVVAEDLERLADAGEAELEVGRGDLDFLLLYVFNISFVIIYFYDLYLYTKQLFSCPFYYRCTSFLSDGATL